MRSAEELWMNCDKNDKEDDTWPAVWMVVPLASSMVLSIPESSCLYRFGSNIYRLTVIESYDCRLEPVKGKEEKKEEIMKMRVENTIVPEQKN